MSDRQAATWRIDPDHSIYEKVSSLVSWDHLRVQVHNVPTSRLAPYDISWTHRGCCLQHSDGEVGFESDYIADLAHL